MNMIHGIILTVGIFSAFIFFGWLFKTLSNGDVNRIFRWIRNVLIVCFLINLSVWIIKIIAAHSFFDQDYTSLMLLLVAFFMAIDYIVYKILKKSYFKQSRPLLGRYYSGKRRFDADMLGSEQYRLWMIATLSIVAVPVFVISNVCYLISTYFF